MPPSGIPANRRSERSRPSTARAARPPRAGHQQYFASASEQRHGSCTMNASRPLFASARLRRAVNYAIDRQALVAQERRFLFPVFGGGGQPIGDLHPVRRALDARRLPPLSAHGPTSRRRSGSRVTLMRRRSSTRRLKPSVATGGRAIIQPEICGRSGSMSRSRCSLSACSSNGSGSPRRAVRSRRHRLCGFGSTRSRETGSRSFDGSAISSPNNNNNFSHFDDPAFNRELHAIERLSGAKRYLAFNRLAYRLERDEAPCGRDRDRHEPGLLLRPHRLSGVPARLRHGSRRPLPAAFEGLAFRACGFSWSGRDRGGRRSRASCSSAATRSCSRAARPSRPRRSRPRAGTRATCRAST